MRKAKFLRVGFSLSLATLTAMSNPLLRLSLVGIGAIATLPTVSPAEAATLTQWQFDPNTLELRVTVPEGTTPRYFLLAQPPRIVLDLPNTQVGRVPEQQTFTGAVRQIRVGQFQPGLTRIVIELAADAEFAPGQLELRQEGDRWILRPLLTDGTATPNIATAPVQPAPVQPSLPEVEASEAAEVIPEATPPESMAIAPSPPLPSETTAAELGNDLPQLNPAPLAPAISDSDISSVPEASPEADSETTEIAPESDTPVNDTPESDTPVNVPSALPPANVPPADLPPIDLPSANLPSADLPPLEPGALEIPVEPVLEVPEILELVPPTSESERAAEPISEQVELEDAETDGAIALEPEVQPEAIASVPQIPTALPPATFSASPSVTVTVPPLSNVPSNPTVVDAPASSIPQPSQPAALPPATFSPDQSGQVSVPPVSTIPDLTIPDPTAAALESAPQPESEIEFGQPISGQSASPLPPLAPTATPPDNLPENNLPENNLPDNHLPNQNVAVAPTSPHILLPSGTVLGLRYPGETSLSLESGVPRQEVLLLDQPVLDRNGNLIMEAGSQVIGRFETGSRGSQFVAQAVVLQGQNVLLEAESDMLTGDREVSDSSLLQNSALGALALTVLGGFTGIGLLGGLAAGATATYLTAPQPAIIQPNQIVEVRLIEDLPRP